MTSKYGLDSTDTGGVSVKNNGPLDPAKAGEILGYTLHKKKKKSFPWN
jgi:hypothetical protein